MLRILGRFLEGEADALGLAGEVFLEIDAANDGGLAVDLDLLEHAAAFRVLEKGEGAAVRADGLGAGLIDVDADAGRGPGKEAFHVERAHAGGSAFDFGLLETDGAGGFLAARQEDDVGKAGFGGGGGGRDARRFLDAFGIWFDSFRLCVLVSSRGMRRQGGITSLRLKTARSVNNSGSLIVCIVCCAIAALNLREALQSCTLDSVHRP